MTGTQPVRRIMIALALAVVLSGTGAAVILAAQTREVDPQTLALRELIAEVRALRAVIETYASGQAQARALGDLLTVQQRRVAEITARLDVVRKDLDGVVNDGRRMASEIERFESSLRQAPPSSPREREGAEAALQQMKLELQQRAEQEQQTRVREAELTGTLALEEAKWNELVERLNQTLRR